MPKTEVLIQAYAAFNLRDVDAVLALMAPDVDWPNAIEGTRAIGHDQIRTYWRGQWATLNPQVNPVAIEELAGNRAIVHVHRWYGIYPGTFSSIKMSITCTRSTEI